LDDSSLARVSVLALQVLPGQEQEFLTLVDQLGDVFRERGYGFATLLQDSGDPRLYYHLRTWASGDALARCHDDAAVQSLWAQLTRTMRFTNLVGMAQPVDPWAVAAGRTRRDRRSAAERRAAAERRLLDLRPPGEERRSEERRRPQPRRTGLERRGRPERRVGERRVLPERRQTQIAGWSAEHRQGERRTGHRRQGGDRRGAPAAELGTRSESARAAVLVRAARAARNRATAPFSGFKVGAAVETLDGAIVTGCNIENATYGLTICAERVAVFKALSDGRRGIRRVAIVTDMPNGTMPCGACRQILWEFGGDLEVVTANLVEEKGRYRLKDLLPLAFDASSLAR
jgi:cytidine deaminase